MSAALKHVAVIYQDRRYPHLAGYPVGTSVREFEPCPVALRDEVEPHYGGLLFYNTETGLAGCAGCGWSGVPTVMGGEFGVGRFISTRCPACEISEATEALRVAVAQATAVVVARNEPCPCGSGRKAKKCSCLEYRV